MSDPIDQRDASLKLKQLRKVITDSTTILNNNIDAVEANSDVLVSTPDEWALIKSKVAAIIAAAI